MHIISEAITREPCDYMTALTALIVASTSWMGTLGALFVAWQARKKSTKNSGNIQTLGKAMPSSESEMTPEIESQVNVIARGDDPVKQ